MNEQTKQYVREVSSQVAMALNNNNTPEAVKDCLKTIIFEASTEADLTISDFALIADALPNVIEKLPTDYGRGFLHSIAAIIRQDTDVFQQFYDKRLDQTATATAQPVENNMNMNDEIKLNRDGIISHDEIELLIDSLLTDAEFHPYAVYGLMFLFGSIKKALEAGWTGEIENICLSALLKLYSVSDNAYEAIDRVTKNIHVLYRAADFKNENRVEISAPFVKSERFETAEKPITEKPIAVPNLPEQPDESESLNKLANQFAEIMQNPNLPRDIYNVLTDEFARIQNPTDTPENILINLKALCDEERRERRE